MTSRPVWLPSASSPPRPGFRLALRPRARGLLLLTAVVTLAALITGRSILYNLAYLLIALLLVSLAWAWSAVRDLEIRRIPRVRRQSVGGFFEETLILRNTGFFPKVWLEIRDGSNLPGHRASFVLDNLGPQRERLWTARTRCRRRGLYRLGPLTLIGTDPFGLFEATLQLAETSEVLIYPPVLPLWRIGLPVGLWRSSEAARRRTSEVTPSAGGVREYQPGDAFHRIHWPSTARRDRLMVKEFDQDPAADLWIVLDMMAEVHVQRPLPEEEWDLGAPRGLLPPSTEEYAVAAAASLAAYFLKRERAVGLLAYGSQRLLLPPHRGEAQLERILEGLALLRAYGTQPFHDVLQTHAMRMVRGAVLILITPSGDPRWAIVARSLDGHGIRVAAVVLEASSFGGAETGPRVLPILQSAGIPTAVIRFGEALPLALEALGAP
ncbi:DUF58 domain-containing protein [Thermoflexus sp.]|jgi:uncharacterized protein (DUF58 family)|uniref:DUF58 domain-containing protein n=1 Tax=Thermoflexus sp. TaxID=1969742 RepID=UPI002607D6A1|nr:DUF58 domain-containing protein [Thermoflexus sp.]